MHLHIRFFDNGQELTEIQLRKDAFKNVSNRTKILQEYFFQRSLASDLRAWRKSRCHAEMAKWQRPVAARQFLDHIGVLELSELSIGHGFRSTPKKYRAIKMESRRYVQFSGF